MSRIEKTPVTEIERICATGQPLQAQQHVSYGERIRSGEWDLPMDMIVGKRRTIVQPLGSGAVKTVLLDYTAMSAGAVGRFNPRTVDASITTFITASRPYGLRGRYHAEQQTALGLDLLTDGSLGAYLGGTIPFDASMEAATREAWQEWGVKLHYHIDERGGEYAFELEPDYEARILESLAAIE